MIDNSLNKREGDRIVFLTTRLLGAVQLVAIIIGGVKLKLIAVCLGTTGFGIMGLFNSSYSLLSFITNSFFSF